MLKNIGSARIKLLLVMLALVTLFSVYVYLSLPMPAIFELKTHRLLHILGGVMFVGNILTGAMWMIFSDLQKSPMLFRFSIRGINLADSVFTSVGALLLLHNGSVLSLNWGGLWSQSWLKTSLLLFTIVGVIWAVVLVPLQIYFERASENIEEFSLTFSTSKFRTRLIGYFVAGSAIGALVISILVLMVFKP